MIPINSNRVIIYFSFTDYKMLKFHLNKSTNTFTFANISRILIRCADFPF